MSVLSKSISYYPGITATSNGVDINLLSLLQSKKHKEEIMRLRQAEESVQKQLKEKLPCYTVAGTFRRRCEEGIVQLSGLAAVDLDSAENYDVIILLKELRRLDCIAYAGLSCRGKRLFCIVPFQFPDKYVRHYERLIKSFDAAGLPMGDECHKIISQPRFVSLNEEHTQFFNHNAMPYRLLAPEKTFHFIKPVSNNNNFSTGGPANPFRWCVEQINKSYSFSEKNRHQYLIRLARYCNLKGLKESETLKGCLSFQQTDFPEMEISKIVTHIYKKHLDSHNKYPFK